MENEFTDKFPSSKRVPFVHSEFKVVINNQNISLREAISKHKVSSNDPEKQRRRIHCKSSEASLLFRA